MLQLEDKHYRAIDFCKSCRTIKLGRGVVECKRCKKVDYIYRSCKHRFCATCSVSDTMKWTENQLTKLLNFEHHHIIFTLPKPYRLLAKWNGNILYNLFFKAVFKVINQWFADEHTLKVGSFGVLHTAGSDLNYHPHIHIVVSRGGQDLTTQVYRNLAGKFLCKNELFGRLLKKYFNDFLVEEYRKGQLVLFKNIRCEVELIRWMNKQKDKHWIVNICEPLKDVEHIIGYVGRYTKRPCISEYRLKEVNQDHIKYSYNDYKNSDRKGKPKEAMRTLTPVQFLDRLLQHVPNKGFKMVRYGGLYNGFHINKIPTNYKIPPRDNDDINWEELYGEDYEWGIFEHLRKAYIRVGKPDPMICQNCKVVKTLVGVEFPNFSIPMYNDSS